MFLRKQRMIIPYPNFSKTVGLPVPRYWNPSIEYQKIADMIGMIEKWSEISVLRSADTLKSYGF